MGGYENYRYEIYGLDSQHPLKIIGQHMFNHAAEHGFPPDFFKDSYFDHVAIHCLPEGTDCSQSAFRNCVFSGCQIDRCLFDETTIYDSVFQGVQLSMVNFIGASIAHTHFRDSSLVSVSFQDARLKSCLTRDCRMERVDFQGATLDGSSYGRVSAKKIFNLRNASITQGGATHEEVERLRGSIFRELGVPLVRFRQRPAVPRQGQPLER